MLLLLVMEYWSYPRDIYICSAFRWFGSPWLNEGVAENGVMIAYAWDGLTSIDKWRVTCEEKTI